MVSLASVCSFLKNKKFMLTTITFYFSVYACGTFSPLARCVSMNVSTAISDIFLRVQMEPGKRHIHEEFTGLNIVLQDGLPEIACFRLTMQS